MEHRASGIGSMPGADVREAIHVVLGEVGGLPFLPELPARGPAAGMVGRTLGLVGGLGVDLQPAGWRLTDAAGRDQRRAASLVAEDLDRLEELAHGHRGPLKVQVVGPWTLAATVERPRGDKVLADHGARRELAQALAEAVSDHVADVRRRLSAARVVVSVDEPLLPDVLAGRIATASGFGRHREVDDAEAARALGWTVAAVEAAGAEPVLHCCAVDVPITMLRSTAFRGLSIDLSLLPTGRYDDIAAWIDDGRMIWAGLVPATDPAAGSPDRSETGLTTRLAGWLSALGFADPESLPSLVVTPTCGLAGASPDWAHRALHLCARVAESLSEYDGRMEA